VNPLLIILAVVVVFGVLVTVHEMGHLLVAKLMGVKVLEFSVGFGQPLFKVQRGETTYGVRMIPLGGFVRLAGMDDDETGPRSFNAKPVWRRILIIAAGSLTNLLLPIAIFFAVFVGQAGAPVTVKSVTQDFPAARAGIRPGDTLLQVDGRQVTGIDDFRTYVNGSAGRPVQVWIRHPGAGSADLLTIYPQKQDGRFVVGVVPSGSFDIVQGVQIAVKQWWAQLSAIFVGFYEMARGAIPGGIAGRCGPSGPVGIVRATGEAAQAGVIPLALFAGFLSLNLGILNLMPIPALDGGRLFFLLIEAVRRKPINPRHEQRVHYAGLVVLLGLIVLISFNDVLRLQQPFADLVNSCSG
jgi:regulator of sigma E protease